MENQTFTAQQVLSMLMSQQFVDWYENKFMNFVEGEGPFGEEAILKDLAYYLNGR
jgi:hypothetical protein